MKWKRYRFYTSSVDDCRPLVFNTEYPWWCTGYTGDGEKAIIVAYLPPGEDLDKYWDDAEDVDYQERDIITFTSRFGRPDWYTGKESEYETI